MFVFFRKEARRIAILWLLLDLGLVEVGVLGELGLFCCFVAGEIAPEVAGEEGAFVVGAASSPLLLLLLLLLLLTCFEICFLTFLLFLVVLTGGDSLA